MAERSRYRTNFAFIDLLFNLLVGITLLFFLAFILINPVAKKKDIEAKAEYLITMTWPERNNDDIDIWVMDNQKHIVSFRNKDDALISLDRDDLGTRNDEFIEHSTKKVIRIYQNREVISIRSKDPRRYLVTVHKYMNTSKEPTHITIELTEINPYKIHIVKKLVLDHMGDEKQAFEFEVMPDGSTIVEETERLVINDPKLGILNQVGR
jgi:hypothetical protein